MDEKLIYLLQNLGAPEKKVIESFSYHEIIKKAEKSFGIQINHQPIGQKEAAEGAANRFFFHFPEYYCDEKKATHIGESVLLGIEISFGHFDALFSPDPIYAFPSSLFEQKGFITVDELIGYEESKPYGQRVVEFPRELLSAQWIFEIYIKAAWKIATVLFENQSLFNGANFLKSSQERFFVWPGQYDEVIGDTSVARAGWEQAKLEDALFNAYKTIEAVIGDVPKDDRKFFSKLEQVGINPQEIVGYKSKKEIHTVIRDFNEERDKKAAHGKTPNRDIAIGLMFEYQACARFVLITAIESYLGEPIY